MNNASNLKLSVRCKDVKTYVFDYYPAYYCKLQMDNIRFRTQKQTVSFIDFFMIKLAFLQQYRKKKYYITFVR